MTLSDSWDTPPSNPNNRRSSVATSLYKDSYSLCNKFLYVLYIGLFIKSVYAEDILNSIVNFFWSSVFLWFSYVYFYKQLRTKIPNSIYKDFPEEENMRLRKVALVKVSNWNTFRTNQTIPIHSEICTPANPNSSESIRKKFSISFDVIRLKVNSFQSE